MNSYVSDSTTTLTYRSHTTMVPDVMPDNSNRTNISCNRDTCVNNGTVELPDVMRFGTLHLISVSAYSCFFVIAAVGNLTVFITLFRNRNMKSRVNMFIMHLSIADLIVTFIMMPMEIIWGVTVEWKAGDMVCRIMMFFRTFGLYLSSFILVVISLDRYFAILHPLSLNDADKRGKIMLAFAWILSGISSLPQSIIFHVEAHPDFPWYKQCVTFNFYPSDNHELVYNFFNMMALYGLPLIIITMSYTLILREISKKTKQSKEELVDLNSSIAQGRLRRSAVGNIERARTRTLKMTIVIVTVFVFCWTPYYVISVWWWLDKESVKELDKKIPKVLFVFAVSNTCVNPIVYGLFTINFKREFRKCCCCLKARWTDRRYDGYTGITLTVREAYPRPAASQVSYSSVRVSQNSSGMKVNLNKAMDCKSPVRFTTNVHAKKLRKDAINGVVERYDASTGHSKVNLNNFMSVQLPKQDGPNFNNTL